MKRSAVILMNDGLYSHEIHSIDILLKVLYFQNLLKTCKAINSPKKM